MDRLKPFLAKNGLTQTRLAKKLGVKQTAISNWGRGFRVPSPNHLFALSRELNENPVRIKFALRGLELGERTKNPALFRAKAEALAELLAEEPTLLQDTAKGKYPKLTEEEYRDAGYLLLNLCGRVEGPKENEEAAEAPEAPPVILNEEQADRQRQRSREAAREARERPKRKASAGDIPEAPPVLLERKKGGRK